MNSSQLKLDANLRIRWPKSLADKLTTIAASHRRSRNAEILVALEEWAKKHEEKE